MQNNYENLDKNSCYISFENVNKTYKLYKKITLRNILLKKYINEKVVLNNISFKALPGEDIGIIGKNGAGKSTILKLITGVSYPTSGSIKTKGRITSLLELKAGFDPELTGRDNIYLRLNLYKYKKNEYKKIVNDIIDFAQIDDYIDQPIKIYSSGMRARLGFAICINTKPDILIIDEALSAGDANFKEKCFNKINELKKEKNIIFILVSHSTKMLEKFCKRGIVIESGSIKFDGNICDAINCYNTNLHKENKNEQKANL